MDGVTILNIYTENVSFAGYIIASIMTVFLIIVLSIALYFVSEKFSEFNGYVLSDIILIALLVTILLISLFELKESPKEPSKFYEVTISENVSFKDFTSKYEIIEQRGEIYVVKEREENE